MKKTAIWLATAVVGILLPACMGFEQTVGPEAYLAPGVSLKQVEVSSGTLYVTLTGEVSGRSNDNMQCGFYFGKNSDLSDASKLDASMSVSRFSSATPSLEYETTYYYKAFISNGKEEICSSVGNFKTGAFDFYAKAGQPSVVQDSKGTVSVTSAVTVASGIELTSQGICYGKNANPSISSISSNKVESVLNKDISVEIKNLDPGTTYFFRAYLMAGTELVYSDDVSYFTHTLPVIVTEDIKDITSESAVSGGLGIKDNGKAITEKGLVWSTQHAPTVSSAKLSCGSGVASFSAKISGLKPATTYYVRAYAINADGVGYGEEKSFTTKAGAPTVTTSAATNVTTTGATVGGNVTSDGGTSVTERGVVWSTSQNPTTSSNKKAVGSGTGSFTAELTGLKYATTYYVRAYAVNSTGTSYGEEKSFTTKAVAPTVTTSSATNITATGATVGGNVTSDGGASVTERGVVWSTSQNPTTSSNKKAVGSGTGSFTADLAGLSLATTYYVRAYAINATGTSYGEEISFKTGTVAPSVTTGSVSNVTSSGATVGGDVTSDGGTSVTERGVVWSTSQNPTTSSNKKAVGSGTGSFTADLTGLSLATTYYVRAYAINATGTSYGEEKSFTTKAVAPTVTTSSATNITATGATVGGNVTSDGGASVTERGVVWSTSQNPTTSSKKKAVGSGTGSFSTELTGLSVATTYYVRAYAINATGTSYGEEISFKTGSIAVTSVSLSLSSLTLRVAESHTLVATVLPANATDKSVTWTSSSPSVATVSSTGQITGKTAGTCVISVKSVNGISASCTVTVRPLEDADTENVDKYDYEFGEAHEYVDLGLSVKWATCNLGASKSEEYGGYYQWAGTTDLSDTSIYLDWDNCPYHTGSSRESGWTKYNTKSSYGTIDNRTVLEPIDDAAHVNWGGSWRMPTDAEWTELIENCIWTWTTQNGVDGYKVTSKKSGYTSNSIFLPAARGSDGLYWSSSLYTDYSYDAYDVYFGSSSVYRSARSRYGGLSVRPVSE